VSEVYKPWYLAKRGAESRGSLDKGWREFKMAEKELKRDTPEKRETLLSLMAFELKNKRENAGACFLWTSLSFSRLCLNNDLWVKKQPVDAPPT